MTSLT
jgi:hypothetical protein